MSDNGLYVHVPFCIHKCGYCDFNSWAETRIDVQHQWKDALLKQAEFWGIQVASSSFDTIFWGGGTPSLLDSKIFAAVMNHLKSTFQVVPGAEISVECNPETLSQTKLQELWDAGVNRISIGIQSFQDKYLERLERKTSRESNLKVLDLVSNHWPGRWSLDLMYALPEQSLEGWLTELDAALEFSPKHISAYQLTLSTARSKNWKQAPEDELLEFFVLTEERLAEAGLLQYEISNFSVPGYECQHNLHYWRLDPFLGLGPGAAGVIPSAWSGRPIEKKIVGYHQRVASKWETWLAGAGTNIETESWLEPRTLEDHFKELLLMNLRLYEGFPLSNWAPFEGELLEVMRVLMSKGLVEQLPSSNKWRATKRGSQILDTTVQMAYSLVDFDRMRT